MTSVPAWGLARRVGFRFAVVVGALVVFPFPISAIPKADALASWLRTPMEWGASWLAQRVLGLPDPASAFNGSGDRTLDYVQLLLIVILGAIATILWSVVDRKRQSYPRLAAGAHVALRYVLGFAMLSYGFSKILRMQFSDLTPYDLEMRVGDTSPMGMVWRFMGYSAPYTIFAGLAEAIGGAMLLWRRTATIGALVLIPVMTNVVLLNFCYDVPVKLYSTELLIMAIMIAAPSARRLIGAALGRATAEVPPRHRMSRRSERARRIAAVTMMALFAIRLYVRFSGRAELFRPVELQGGWVVDTFTADGVEHPPLTTDDDRWSSCRFSPGGIGITMMTGRLAGPGFGPDGHADARTHTIAVTLGEDKHELWSYAQPAPDRLVIDGMYLGKSLHVTLHRRPAGLLVTRGFRWINEVPFNR
jgi:uncharacterized membrane protein YphA (DoxX/SURF4 family)